MVKNWLILGSVAFSVGFGLSLPITRNIKDSALIGLVGVPAATAGAFAVSRQQKRTIAILFSSLQTEVQTLEQQKESLEQSIAEFQDRQTASEEKCTQLEAQIEQLQAQLSTAELQKQTIHQELSTLEEQKQSVQSLASSLQTEVEMLKQQKQSLDQATATIRNQQQLIENELEQLNAQKIQIQVQLNAEEQQKQIVQREWLTLETRKQSLAKETQQLESSLQELKAQESQLNAALSAIVAHHIQLDSQLSARERERQIVQQELIGLEAHKQALNEENLAIESQLQGLRTQEQQLSALLTQQSEQKQLVEADLNQLQNQLQTYQQQQLGLTQELEELSFQKGELTEFLRQLQEQIQAAQSQISSSPSAGEPENPPESSASEPTEQPVLPKTIVTVLHPPQIEEEFEAPETATEFQLTNPEHTRWLWEAVIVPRWQYPRFLGSTCLPRYDTDEVWGTETILDLVGNNLRRLGTNSLEYNRLFARLRDEDNLNWLKILTFAMSEYAYYMEAEGGFWKGLCERLGLSYRDDSHEPISTLKTLASEGINLLKLPKATGGYPIVSTLWLQSGIPYRNLNHFADLVADLAEEAGWSYLLNADAELLAQKLLHTCQSRYPGRTVLRRFLEYGCHPQTEPVSGELLQSIAGVAIALREFNLQPQEVLLNPSRRQEFLLNAVPQFNFFLRDWDALIQILSPRPNPITRSRHGSEQIPLALRLDIEGLLIELILPEQTLRNADWQPGTCLIQEAEWQGEVDSSGQIEIEECSQPVYQMSEGWQWQLLDEQGNCLRSWYLEGIAPDFPCLIFDAWTGDRLLPDPELIDSHEIFCFAPTETTITCAGLIELAEESLIPCSIQGWQGKRLRLSGQVGTLNFQFSDHTSTLTWTIATAEPRLRGLRLRGQSAPYLETPILWYPPHPDPLSLTLTIQERLVPSNPSLIQQTISVPAAHQWTAIPLGSWISHAGRYSISLTAPEEEWSQTFEVQSPYQVTASDIINPPTVQVTDIQGSPVALPLTVTQSHQFWSTTLLITGLWTLEPIKLLLSDDQSQTSRSVQANALGHLKLELSTLYDLLPSSKQYFLDYQRLGQPAQRLVQLVKDLPLSWNWSDRSLELIGLKADQAYRINCWNLLTPQHPSIEIPIPSTTSATIPLDLPPGIYYLQLETLNKSIETVGWWCGSDQYDLPVDTEEDEALANYCYTILDHALVNEFQAAAGILTWDKNWIETITAALETGNHHFPDWLNAEALLTKLRSILTPLHGWWYKICTSEGKRGDFQDALMRTIAENNLWHLILDFRRHRQRDERNIAFVNLVHLETVRPHLSRISHFEWVSRSPLSPQEVETLPENGDVE